MAIRIFLSPQKRIKAFRSPTPHYCEFVQKFDIPDLQRLEFLNSLELNGLNISFSLPGLRNLFHLRHVKLVLTHNDYEERNMDLLDEICRLRNLKSLDVSGYPRFFSFLCTGRGLNHRGLDLEELYVDWDLEVRNLKPQQRQFVAAPEFFAGRFVNLKALELGPSLQRNRYIGWESMHGCWTSIARLEKLGVDMYELCNILPHLNGTEENSWASNVQDLTVYCQPASLVIKNKDRENVVSLTFQRIAQWMNSLRRLRFVVSDFCFSRSQPRFRPRQEDLCDHIDIPISRLSPLSSTLEVLEILAPVGTGVLSQPGMATTLMSGVPGIAAFTPHLSHLTDLSYWFQLKKVADRMVSRLIPKIQLEDIRFLSNLKVVKFLNFEFSVSKDKHLTEFDVHGVDSTRGPDAFCSTSTASERASESIDEFRKQGSGTFGVPHSDSDISTSDSPREGLPVLRCLELVNSRSFFRIKSDGNSAPSDQESQRSNADAIDGRGQIGRKEESPCDFLSSLDLSDLQEFRLSELFLGNGNEEFRILCEKIFSKCPRLEIIDLSRGVALGVDRKQFGSGTLKECNPIKEILGCSLKRLKVLNLSLQPFKHPALRIDTPIVAPNLAWFRYSGRWNDDVFFKVATRFPLLGNTSWIQCALPSCGLPSYRIDLRLALNRARWRVMRKGLPNMRLWPTILSKKTCERAFKRYPEDLATRAKIDTGGKPVIKLRNEPFRVPQDFNITIRENSLRDRSFKEAGADLVYLLLREVGAGLILEARKNPERKSWEELISKDDRKVG